MPAVAQGDLVAEWRAATTDGCLPALEADRAFAPEGFVPAPDLALPYDALADLWRAPSDRFVLGAVALPGSALPGHAARRLCEAVPRVYLRADTVNALYADFLDWAEAAREAGRYRFLGTRRNEDWLTGLASLASIEPNPRGYLLEVTFVAQPAEGRVSFAAQELRPEVLQ